MYLTWNKLKYHVFIICNISRLTYGAYNNLSMIVFGMFFTNNLTWYLTHLDQIVFKFFPEKNWIDSKLKLRENYSASKLPEYHKVNMMLDMAEMFSYVRT